MLDTTHDTEGALWRIVSLARCANGYVEALHASLLAEDDETFRLAIGDLLRTIIKEAESAAEGISHA